VVIEEHVRLHSPSWPLNILAQNYIELEPGPFKARPLDSLGQIARPFTNPIYGKEPQVHRSEPQLKSLNTSLGKLVPSKFFGFKCVAKLETEKGLSRLWIVGVSSNLRFILI